MSTVIKFNFRRKRNDMLKRAIKSRMQPFRLTSSSLISYRYEEVATRLVFTGTGTLANKREVARYGCGHNADGLMVALKLPAGKGYLPGIKLGDEVLVAAGGQRVFRPDVAHEHAEVEFGRLAATVAVCSRNAS